MAELPSINNVVPMVREPQPRVSPSQIAQPYNELAATFDKLGEVVEKDVAVPLAEKAGLRAVARDANGDVQIDKLPIFGEAAVAYGRSVKTAALADADGQARRDDIALRTQHRDDPDGYLNAANAYRKEKIQQYTDLAGPEVGVALGRVIDTQTTQTYRGLLNEHEHLTLQRTTKSLETGIQSARDDLTAMARGGVTSGPDWDAALDKVKTLTAERVANPRLAYPQVQADFDLQHLQGELRANGFLYHVDKVYKDAPTKAEGAKAAMDYAGQILTDPSLKLTQAQREAYYHKAIGEIRANEALRKQDGGEARLASQQLIMASSLGAKVEPEMVESVAKLHTDAGDQAGAARLYAHFARAPLNDDFGRQPLAAQTQQLSAVQGQAAAKAAFDFFRSRGYTSAQASGIVGNLIHESGLDPNAVHDQGTGIGIAGFRLERAQALAQFARERGTSPTDFRTQLEFIDKELRGGAATVGTQNLEAADRALSLTPQEKALYQRHLTNLTGPGGVDNPNGSRSTLFQMSFERDGKTYNIPTVWDGKILSPDDAIKRAEKEGLDKFPSYGSEAEAEKRYQQMHDFMERDTQQFLRSRGQQGSENRAFQALQAATTPEQAAAAFIHYERPQGYNPNDVTTSHAFESRVALSKQVFGGQGNIDVNTPASAVWLQANRARTLDTAARKQWAQVVADYDKEHIRPPDKVVGEIIDAARATGDHDLLETIAATGDRLAVVQDAAERGLPAQAAQIAELHRQGAEGFLQPGQQAILKDLEQRYKSIQTGLNDNPIATTTANFGSRFQTPAPLNVADPDQLAAGLAYRGKIAQFAAQNWQTGPLPAVDKADLAALSAALQNPDPNVKAGVLNAITTALPEAVRAATLQKLGEQGHEQLVAVAAGGLMPVAPDIAKSILIGQKAKVAEKGYLPEGGLEKTNYNEALDKALPASMFTLETRTNPTGGMAMIRGAVEARYAFLSAQAGDTKGKLVEDRLQQAITDITGGILTHNGKRLIAPARGMPQARFDVLLYGINERDLAGVTDQAGNPITPGYLRGRATLESVGDGRYGLLLGTNPDKPIYAYTGANTEMPQKFILDMRGRAATGTPPEYSGFPTVGVQ